MDVGPFLLHSLESAVVFGRRKAVPCSSQKQGVFIALRGDMLSSSSMGSLADKMPTAACRQRIHLIE